MSTAPPAAPAQRRPRRIVVLALVALLVSPPAFFWYRSWSAARDLEAALAETDALDPGWRMEELLASRPPIPDDENAALQVERAAKAQTMAANPGLKSALDDLSPVRQLSAAQHDALRRYFTAEVKAREEARKLQDFPDGRFALDADLQNIAGPLRALRPVRDLLYLDIAVRAHEGDADGAVDSCRALLYAARSLADEPSMSVMLSRTAAVDLAVHAVERALAQSSPSTEALSRLQAALQREERGQDHCWLQVMRGERARTFQFLRAVHSGEQAFATWRGELLEGGAPSSWRERLAYYAPTVVIDPATHLRNMNLYVESARLPPHEQLVAVAQIDGELTARDPLQVALGGGGVCWPRRERAEAPRPTPLRDCRRGSGTLPLEARSLARLARRDRRRGTSQRSPARRLRRTPPELAPNG